VFTKLRWRIRGTTCARTKKYREKTPSVIYQIKTEKDEWKETRLVLFHSSLFSLSTIDHKKEKKNNNNLRITKIEKARPIVEKIKSIMRSNFHLLRIAATSLFANVLVGISTGSSTNVVSVPSGTVELSVQKK